MLTDKNIKGAAPTGKAYKLYDAAGLHLVVTPSGGKLWRLRYQYGGKEKLLSFGPYPDLTLAAARTARDEAKAALREGRDPGQAKRLRKAAATTGDDSFEAVAREWHELNKARWTPDHAARTLISLELDIFPAIGSMHIAEITPADVLSPLRAVEQREAVDTARRIRQRVSAVFVYAISTGRRQDDPAAVVKGAMKPIVKRGKQPAITDLAKARDMLLKVESEPGHPVTKLALRILALTAVRPGTLAVTPWDDWNKLDKASPVWHIPAERMKLRLQHKDDSAKDFFVPLAPQAVDAIEALRQISGRGPLAFPNARHAHKPMSENAMSSVLKRIGYFGEHVPHGWRSTFSSVMNERFPADRAIIDLMLAHIPKDNVERAYNRAQHMTRRRELAQAWADMLLDGVQPAAALLEGPRR